MQSKNTNKEGQMSPQEGTRGEGDWLSRTALADCLNLSLKAVTQLLLDSGWIQQKEKAFRLTAKGEFEGGIYRQSKKYGEYVVWPRRIIEHAIFKPLISAPQLVSARQLAKQLDVPARLLQLLLKELGWVQPLHKGWSLTPLGQAMGAEQKTNEKTGIPYALWPLLISENSELIATQRRLNGESRKEAGEILGLNGHCYSSRDQCRLANWLYLNNLTFAIDRPIGPNSSAQAHFYLPLVELYMDLNTAEIEPRQLADLMARQSDYRERNLDYLEIATTEWEHLDMTLARVLLEHGIDV